LLDQLHEQEVAARLPPVAAEDFPMSATKTIKKHHSLSLRRMLGFGKSSKKLDISFASAVETKTLTEEVYGGRITSTCVCSHCQSESSTSESFTDLTLAFPDDSAAPGTKSAAGDSRFVVGSHTLPGGRTHPYADHNENVFATIHAAGKTVFLPSMFEQLLKPERLVGSNQYRCSRCESLRDGERRVSITSAPMCLVLTLLRFAFNAKTGSNDKICTDVSYPLTLLVPVVPQIDACGGSPADGSVRSTSKLPPPAPPAVQYVQYGLTGVVIHAGLTSEGGHYYCYARHSRTPSERHGADFAQLSDRGPAATGVVGSDQDSFTDEWYMFNDEHVTSSSFADIRTLAAQFPRDTAYVLFYCRVDRESAGKGTLKERSSSAAGEQLQPHLAALVDEDNAAYQKVRSNFCTARWL
jgi:ubiquitin carboxyl-terminal hydrolase 35/38